MSQDPYAAIADDALGVQPTAPPDAAPDPDGGGYATVFGLNPDGSVDQDDNGQGHWGANTRDPSLAGVSLPRSVLRQQFGDEENANGKMVEVTNPATGKKSVLPIVDIGPGETTGNALDLTYAANRQLGGNGKTPMQYRFADPTASATPKAPSDPYAAIADEALGKSDDPYTAIANAALTKTDPEPETPNITAPKLNLNLAPGAAPWNPVPAFRVQQPTDSNTPAITQDTGPSLQTTTHLDPGSLSTGMQNTLVGPESPAAQEYRQSVQKLIAQGMTADQANQQLRDVGITPEDANTTTIGGGQDGGMGIGLGKPILPHLTSISPGGVPQFSWKPQDQFQWNPDSNIHTPSQGEAVIRGLSNSASDLSTPENLAMALTIPEADPVLQKAITGYFAGQMTRDSAAKLGAATQMPYGPERTQAITEALVTGGFGLMSAAHLGSEVMPEGANAKAAREMEESAPETPLTEASNQPQVAPTADPFEAIANDALSKKEASAPQPEEAEPALSDAMPAPKTYDEAQARIDQIEDGLEANGLNVTRMVDPNDPVTRGLLNESGRAQGWSEMPPELVRAYKDRDDIGAKSFEQSRAEISDSLSGNGLSPREIDRVLDYYGISANKSDAIAQNSASEHAVKLAQGSPERQAEMLAYAISAERGEMTDELRDVSLETLQDAAKAVRTMRRYFGLESPDARPALTGDMPRPEVDALPAPKPSPASTPPDYETESKRVYRGESGQTKPVTPTPEERQAIIDSYQQQVAKTGFPAVKIADVMEGAGLPLNDRSRGLVMGMGADGDVASLPSGDWSASTERQRAWGVRPQDADNVANGGHVGLMMKLRDDLRTAPEAPAPTEGVDALSLKELAAKPKEIAQDVEGTVSPSTVDKPAEEMGLGIRSQYSGPLEHEKQGLAARWEPARKMFSKMDEAGHLDFIKRMEDGTPQTTPALQTVADDIRSELDKRVGDVRALGTGKLQQVIQNYFPHIWDIDQKNSGNIFQRIFSKKPIEGSKSFLKKRTIPTVEQGIAAGLKLKTSNPIEQAILKAHEMDKYTHLHRMQDMMEKSGLIKKFKIGQKEEGWSLLEGPESQIWGPPTVKVQETVDKAVFDGLNNVAKGLGIDTERVMRPKGPGLPPGSLGASFRGQDRVQTRFATPMSVLAHEIGHQINDKFNFLDKLRKTVPNADLELGNIAALTNRGKGAFTDPEMAAQTLEAYIHAPETMEAVAPNVFKAFDDFLAKNPKLAGLRDIKPGLELATITNQVGHGGRLLMGQLHAPDKAARVYNNFQSQGLAGRPAYDAVRFAADHLNALQLALSGFHATGVTANSIFSQIGRGATDLMTGHPIKAASKILTAPIAPITDAIRGGKILKEYMNPGSTDAKTAQDVQNIVKGGGRARAEGVHKFGAFQSMMDAFHKGEASVLWHAPMALLQAPMAIIHNQYVPRIKLAVAAAEAADDLARLPAGASELDKDRVRAQAWDNVDDRFGQMTYDNLFWHKTFKDLTQIGTRSVGWNLGTLRAGYGAAKDAVTAPGRIMRGEQGFTQRMGYAAALPMGVALMGAVYQYAHTGQGPQELKDYFYPRTGKTLPDGTPERIVMPTYMKDVASYSHHAVQTVTNKLNPLWSTLAEMIQNKDFYGTQIRNPEDPVVKQMEQEGKFLAKTALPFSVTSQSHRQDQGPEAKAESFMGLQPPPAQDIRSKAAQQIADWHALHAQGGQTQEEFDKTQARHAITTTVRAHGDISTAVHDGRSQGLTEPQIQTALKAAQQSPIAGGFKGLPVEEMQRILPMATPAERAVWAPILAARLQRQRR